MAHKKATGSKANQGSNVSGKRLGIKIFGDQKVTAGSIILRQIGNKFFPGDNVGQGRDFSLFATKEGKVSFYTRLGKKYISVK
jgi:large subunit ribosomal protein L27